jgi:hypothetical protein
MDRRNMGPALAILTIILATVVVAVSAGGQVRNAARVAAVKTRHAAPSARSHELRNGAQSIGAKRTWRP